MKASNIINRRNVLIAALSIVALATVVVLILAKKGSDANDPAPHSSNEEMSMEAGTGTDQLMSKEHDHRDGDGHDGKSLYTCGMHPNVIQEEPGNCPICGMTLVPMKKTTQARPSANTAPDAATKEKKIKYWVAPMDPKYISDKPGKSPMGMDLVPVYEKENTADQDESANVVTIDPVVVQNMGVRLSAIELGEVTREIRTLGEVEVAEDQISVVNLRFSGWIEKIWADQTEKPVKKGEPLFQIYSPEVVAAQEEFLLALENGTGDENTLLKSARQRLLLWEVPQSHINKVAKTKNGKMRLVIRAPRSGYVLHKNVVLGNRINAGKDLYRIGKLKKIWVKADVYEFDAPFLKEGQKAKMYLTFQAGKTYPGVIAHIYPTLNPKSRTLTVRLEFENPGLALKPGMFATVYIESLGKKNVLTVPTEAVIHSGERNIVFVSLGGGKYEPREVITGLEGDNHRTEVLSGLNSGEMAVVSGQFLLDSESQLQEALQKLLAAKLQIKQNDKQDK